MRRTVPARIVMVSSVILLFSLLASLLAMLILHREISVGAALEFTGVLTYHNDSLRTGWNTSETTLTLKNVNSTTFGKLFVIPTDGLVDAQLLYCLLYTSRCV